MITLDDLKKNAKFRAVMFLDMENGGYLNSYVSKTYPRLSVNKSGSKGKHFTTYFVDDMECPDLDAVINLLNATPHPKRTALGRHEGEMG
jgi:hypothetical protein